ncbi:hypothetical protein BPP43_07855 [Brachyspira pilosicoli P43/6/78]|uniref:Uncharacterized protein n=1 Tax=Brachyspira pilosicoli P43/6/78 TaxID=1042417 RepID=A0A3B6W1F3_BRAPL|nr:hypothetical protein BPP43_07855 [Brachyspira pilosicoli P43/6/78]
MDFPDALSSLISFGMEDAEDDEKIEEDNSFMDFIFGN